MYMCLVSAQIGNGMKTQSTPPAMIHLSIGLRSQQKTQRGLGLQINGSPDQLLSLCEGGPINLQNDIIWLEQTKSVTQSTVQTLGCMQK